MNQSMGLPDEKKARKGSPTRLLVRDIAIVALVAWLSLQALRRFVADRYIVPSDSMQPTLYGSRESGDIVLVDKLVAASTLRRFDLAVFRSPEDPNSHLVKRVATLGADLQHCWLELRDGDLWLGPDANRLQRVTKDPVIDRDLRVTWFEWPSRNRDPVGQCLLLPRGLQQGAAIELPSLENVDEVRSSLTRHARNLRLRDGGTLGDRWLSTARAVDVSFLDVLGLRHREGGNVTVEDAGFDGTLELNGAEHVFAGIMLRPDDFTFHWRPSVGTVELLCNGEVKAHGTMPVITGAAKTRVEFGFLDGRLFFAIEGRADSLWCEVLKAEWRSADTPTAQPLPKNLLHLGAIGPRSVRVARCSVFRDLHYFRERMIGVAMHTYAIHVEPGTVYLLGDNSFDSRDSRQMGALPIRDFVGQPRCVIGPPARSRWLQR
jgi:hypothetical protein